MDKFIIYDALQGSLKLCQQQIRSNEKRKDESEIAARCLQLNLELEAVIKQAIAELKKES